VVIGAYQGTAGVAAGGRSVELRALRQIALSATGAPPEQASPLTYSNADPWDERFLGGTKELSDELTARSNGFTGQARASGVEGSVLVRQLLPSLATDPTFDRSLLATSRPPGETLVGTAIAVVGKQGSFAARWAAVFNFRDEGADWGLVALDQAVPRAPLLSTLDAAIARATTTVASPTVPRAPRPTAPAAPSPTHVVAPPATPAPTPPTPVPTSPTPPATGPGGVQTGIPLIDDPVNGLIQTLNGLLGGLGRPPPSG
jgi:hypothetical protein